MNKKRIFVIVMLLTLMIPAFAGISKAQAAYPSFTISAVKKDVSVTILTQDMPRTLIGRSLWANTTPGEKGMK